MHKINTAYLRQGIGLGLLELQVVEISSNYLEKKKGGGEEGREERKEGKKGKKKRKERKRKKKRGKEKKEHLPTLN